MVYRPGFATLIHCSWAALVMQMTFCSSLLAEMVSRKWSESVQELQVENLKFSTHADPVKSKTKCIVFSKQTKDRLNIAPILVNEDPLPWVSQVKHLGNVLQNDNSMKVDCSQKRGWFIGKVNSLLQ